MSCLFFFYGRRTRRISPPPCRKIADILGGALVAQSKATDQNTENGTDSHITNGKFWGLVIGAIGVVFGDIGTSPLYAFRVAINATQVVGVSNREAVVGVLSLILWSLILIVTLKYVMVLLRADNKGEGGTFALMALGQSVAKRSAPFLLGLSVAGASFFFGDAVITPAISVLSAVEGLRLVSPGFRRSRHADCACGLVLSIRGAIAGYGQGCVCVWSFDRPLVRGHGCWGCHPSC